MLVKKIFSVAVMAMVLNGCGSSSKSSSGGELDEHVPIGYEYKVINNRGLAVESQLGEYKINLLSNTQELQNPKSVHKGVVVNINGQDSDTMPIQATYLEKEIVVVIYDKDNVLLGAKAVEVTNDAPVVLVNVEL